MAKCYKCDACGETAVGMPDEPGWTLHGMALDMALTALRPVSREQVEKVWAHWITVIDADYIELPPRRDTPERLAKRRRQWLAATLRGLVWPLACAAIGGAAVLIVL